MTAYHYGYARVSTTAQDLTRQLDYLNGQGVPDERIYADKRTGTDFEREGLADVLAQLRPGDVLHLASLDRLGRSLLKMVAMYKHITEDLKAHIVAGGALPVDTRNGNAELAVLLLAFISEVELIFQRERRASARASRESRGVKWGRPATVDREAVLSDFANGLSVRQVRERHGISRAHAFRIKAEGKNGPDVRDGLEAREPDGPAASPDLEVTDGPEGEWPGQMAVPVAEPEPEPVRERTAIVVMPGVLADHLTEDGTAPMEEGTATRKALTQAETIRRGKGYSLRVLAPISVHRELLSLAWPLAGGERSESTPAERKAYRTYADRIEEAAKAF